MKKIINKRFISILFDVFLISLIFSLITMNSKNYNDSISKDLNELMNKYEKEEIDATEFQNETLILNYNLQKNNLSYNILSFSLFFGYFVIFAYMNNGQTIGKKIFKIKVINKDNGKLSIFNILGRSIFIYGLSSLAFSIIFVNILPAKEFSLCFAFISELENILMVTSAIMIIFRKDGRGLHDIIGRTSVVEEVI